jgi:hypothetical protein
VQNKNGARSQWTYFIAIGPATLIVRDGHVESLLGALATKVEYDSIDESGRVISCRMFLAKLQKGDKVFFGRRETDRQHFALTPKYTEPMVGISA